MRPNRVIYVSGKLHTAFWKIKCVPDELQRAAMRKPVLRVGVCAKCLVQELMGHKTIQVTMRYAHLAPAHQLEAVQRLCNTGSARSRATDTRTDTKPLELLRMTEARRTKSCVTSYLAAIARMAKSADAADLKSAPRKRVGVQVPLRAPIKINYLHDKLHEK